MSKTTTALEAAVSIVIENTPKTDGVSSARQRATVDKAFVSILKLIAPRIRHFIRQYGLVGHWDDAEQCCAIAVHRAIQGYDPAKAMFTTFVNWQIRGELQSLRFRLMTDQRPSAKKVDATTISLHAVASGTDGEEATIGSIIEDEGALARTEADASDYLAHAATQSLVREYIDHQRAAGMEQLRKRPRPKRVVVADLPHPATPPLRPARINGICLLEIEKLEQKLSRDREIVERRVFDATTLDELGVGIGITKERVRQITKRASRAIGELAATHPRFSVMAEYRKPAAWPPLRAAKAAREAVAVAILPAVGQLHNICSSIIAITTRPDGSSSSPLNDIPLAVAVESERTDGNALGIQVRH